MRTMDNLARNIGATLLKNSSLIISGTSLAEELEDAVDDGPQVEWRVLVVLPTQHGARLDKALVIAIAEFSRSYLQQMIEEGAVEVNGDASLSAKSRLPAGVAW